MEFGYRTTTIMKNKYLVISCDISLKRGRKEEIYDEMKELMYKKKIETTY